MTSYVVAFIQLNITLFATVKRLEQFSSRPSTNELILPLTHQWG